MYDVDCCLHRGEVGEQERIIETQGTFPRETDTLNPSSVFFTPPSLLSPSAHFGSLTFPSPSLRTSLDFSYCCFIFLSLFLFCCCSDETFFLMLKLLLVFCDGCSTISFLLLRMSLFRGMKRNREGEVWVVP